MDPRNSHSLELLHRAPAQPTRKPALLFVHGAYVGAWCWDVHFLRYFAARGFSSYALSLRGHGASGCDVDYASLGIDDYVDDVERIVAGLSEPPILVGHSMGGLIVSRFLSRSKPARGAVLLAPVPSTGLTPAVFGLALRSPLLFFEMNQVQFGHVRLEALTHVRRALFSAGVDEALVRSFFRRMQPESQRALLEMATLHLTPSQAVPQSPLLVLGAANDGLFAPELISASASGLGAACEILPDMAHAMMLEPGWRGVAERIAEWAERPHGRAQR